MSSKNKASNSKKSAKAYMAWLYGLSYVDKVYIIGSRSPLSKSKPHKDSDWDILVLLPDPLVRIPNPRHFGILHGDVTPIHSEDKLKFYPEAFEVYPKGISKI